MITITMIGVIMGDFNIDAENDFLSEFLESHTLHNHVNFKTCFKSPEGSCIDLILSNKKQSLQHTGSFDTGLSDYHHLIYTFLKSTYVKILPKEIVYREFKNFSNEAFLSDLTVSLDQLYTRANYVLFESILTTVLDRHAPQKKEDCERK